MTSHFSIVFFPFISYSLRALLIYTCYVVLKSFLRPWYSPSPLRNIPGPKPESWFKGNLGQLFNHKGLPFHQALVDEFGGIVKVHGFFGDEQLYISDPRALQSIIVKDQDAFEETAVFIETNKVIFGPGLVATIGEHHKRQRKAVNPMFSVSQLRQLVPVFYEIAEKLSDAIAKQSEANSDKNGDSIVDMSEWMSRVALESVGQTVLGYSFDPLDSPHNNPYTSAVKELIPTIFSLSLVRQFAPFLSRLGSPWFRRKLVDLTPVQSIQKVKNMSDVMYNTAQGILRQKRDTMSNLVESTGPSGTKDIISVLLKANEKASSGERLSESELIGQMTVLIFGAQDTTSAALSRIIYMLSLHPDIQQKVRDEIKLALCNRQENGRLSYDDITSLPWLDAIMKETLRLFPPVPFVRRTAIKERTIPLSQPLDGPGVSSSYVTIPAGTTLFVSIAGPNRLESIWGPDAKEWNPRRWMGDGNAKCNDARLPGIYAGTMSFLGGARSCIGYKFAQVEMKIILVALLSRFTFSPTKDDIVWNLSQIISPSVRTSVIKDSYTVVEEKKGLPLVIRPINYYY